MSHHITTMLTLFYVIILVLFLRNRLWDGFTFQKVYNLLLTRSVTNGSRHFHLLYFQVVSIS